MASATVKALPFAGVAVRLGSAGLTVVELSQTSQINLFRSLVNKVAADLARNPELAQEVLQKAEYDFFKTRVGYARAYGTALERLMAREIENDPELGALLEHVSAPGKFAVDFEGISGSTASGLRFDITTVANFAIKFAKYGNDVLVPTYVRPPFPC